MFAKLISFQKLENKNEFILQGQYTNEDGKEERPSIFLQERISPDDYFIPNRIPLDTEWQGDFFTVHIHLDQLGEYLTYHAIWDCYLALGNHIERIKMEISDFTPTESIAIPNSSVQVKLYETQMNSFALLVSTKDIAIEHLVGKVKENTLAVNFEINWVSFQQTDDINLVFRKRLQPDILYYQQTVSFPVTPREGNTYEANVSLPYLLKTNENQTKQTWDAYIVFIDGASGKELEFPLSVEKNSGFMGRHSITNLANYNFYINYKKALSLTIATKSLLFETINWQVNDDSNVVIQGIVSDDLQIDRVSLVKEGTFSEGELITIANELPFQQLEEIGMISFPYKEIFDSIHFHDGDQYTIYLELVDSNNGIMVKTPVIIGETISVSGQTLEIDNHKRLKLSNDEKLMITCEDRAVKPSENSMKIAVSGSCFSRLAFSSADFYNPNYKSKYELVYTQFHSSIISIMSNPVPFPEEKFIGFNQREVEYIKSDYKKEFFTQLEKTKPEFLILDFYVDGSKDVLMFDEEHIVTINYMLRRNLNYLYEIKDQAKVLTHENVEVYLERWKKNMQEFARELVNYIPEEQIILQKVRKTDGFITKEGKVEKFKDNVKHIKRSNYLFEYMENYFLQLLPKAQVIDLTKRKYYSLYNHPENNTPDHLESAYYRDFLTQLDEITLKNFMKQPRVMEVNRI
ncbi:MAG: DUF6270 domain-containing protein [Niallia sp.]